MGGGGSSHKTKYEQERVGVARRDYGELSETGIQSIEEYGSLKALMGGSATVDPGGSATYSDRYNRWTMGSGVDVEAAVLDWENYSAERESIATQSAKEARRQKAPEDLTGTSGNVDYSLAITDDDKKETSIGAIETDDTSPSTASTSQSLGIY